MRAPPASSLASSFASSCGHSRLSVERLPQVGSKHFAPWILPIRRRLRDRIDWGGWRRGSSTVEQDNGSESPDSIRMAPAPNPGLTKILSSQPQCPGTNMEANEWFEVVRKSRLVDTATLSTWLNRCTRCSDVRTIAAMMVSDGMLTAWQSEKLLDRRWKGFFVDQYCIRNNLGSDHALGVLVLEAMNMQDREILVLEVIPPARERRKDGGLIYSVRPKE